MLLQTDYFSLAALAYVQAMHDQVDLVLVDLGSSEVPHFMACLFSLVLLPYLEIFVPCVSWLILYAFV